MPFLLVSRKSIRPLAAARTRACTRRGLALLAGAGAAALTALTAVRAAPPAIETTATAVAGASASLDAGAGTSVRSRADSATVTFLARRQLAGHWYAGAGAQAETFSFSGGTGWPDRLQDYAAVLAVDYFEGDESVASLTLRPGLYFGHHATRGAWDIPVDLVSGIPLLKDFDGVAGFSSARFYHHALPVAGFVWTISPAVRLEAVYPEPAVVFTFSRQDTLRLGGELTGAGFLAELDGHRSAVEYVSYRIGAEYTSRAGEHCKLALGAGTETDRSFDFFRLHRKLEGHGSGYLKLSVTYSR